MSLSSCGFHLRTTTCSYQTKWDTTINWTQMRKIAWDLLNQTSDGEVSMKKPIIGENSFPSLHGKWILQSAHPQNASKLRVTHLIHIRKQLKISNKNTRDSLAGSIPVWWTVKYEVNTRRNHLNTLESRPNRENLIDRYYHQKVEQKTDQQTWKRGRWSWVLKFHLLNQHYKDNLHKPRTKTKTTHWTWWAHQFTLNCVGQNHPKLKIPVNCTKNKHK